MHMPIFGGTRKAGKLLHLGCVMGGAGDRPASHPATERVGLASYPDAATVLPVCTSLTQLASLAHYSAPAPVTQFSTGSGGADTTPDQRHAFPLSMGPKPPVGLSTRKQSPSSRRCAQPRRPPWPSRTSGASSASAVPSSRNAQPQGLPRPPRPVLSPVCSNKQSPSRCPALFSESALLHEIILPV